MATELLLRGGRVIDPAQGRDGPFDVLVRDGRIAAVGLAVDSGEAEVIDVRGLLVVPGLIDAHVHCFRHFGFGGHGIQPDVLGVGSGVTTVVDAGTAGFTAFPALRHYVMEPAQTRVLAYLNLSTLGQVVGPHYPSLGDPRLIDERGIGDTVAACRDRIVGLKILATGAYLGELGLGALQRGREVGDALRLPLLVHVGESWGQGGRPPAIGDVVGYLRPGDAVTHLFTAHPGGLLDARGRLDPAVHEARDRGVLFDVGHGLHNLSFAVAQQLLDQGFWPDTVSTDGHSLNRAGPVYDLPTTMAKLLALGLPLRDVVAMATCNAARLLGRADELGTLAEGRVADVSVLRLEERDWTAVDSQGERRAARQQLVPVLAVRAGVVHRPLPAERP